MYGAQGRVVVGAPGVAKCDGWKIHTSDVGTIYLGAFSGPNTPFFATVVSLHAKPVSALHLSLIHI